MSKVKYDPLIFGTVNIAEQRKTCDGLMYVEQWDAILFKVMLQCNTCGCRLVEHIMAFKGRDSDRPIICGEFIL